MYFLMLFFNFMMFWNHSIICISTEFSGLSVLQLLLVLQELSVFCHSQWPSLSSKSKFNLLNIFQNHFSIIETNISLLKQIVITLNFGLCFVYSLQCVTVNNLNLQL